MHKYTNTHQKTDTALLMRLLEDAKTDPAAYDKLKQAITGLQKKKTEKKESSFRKIPPEESPTIDKINFMLSFCKNPKERILILTGWNLALRAMELTGLRVYDFDFRARKPQVFIRPEISKGGYSSGYVPLQCPIYIKAVQDYIDENRLEPDDYLFNYSPRKKGYTKHHIIKMCKSIGRRANMGWFHTHMLRHSRARWLFENGCVPDTVRAFLRHRDIITTLRYYGHFMQELHHNHVASLPRPTWVLN